MKKYLLYLLILLLPISIKALTYPEINSKKAIIYDLTTNEIIYEKNSEDVTSIASLTKIMTTITAIENIKDLEEKVTITKEMLNQVRWDASIAGLKVGDVVTYRDLLYASILPSGADATIALAVSTSGSVNNFVKKMNAKATELGLTNTHYVNVTGLDATGHQSSAKDVLNLLLYCFKNPLFKEIYTTKQYTLSNNLSVYSTLKSYSSSGINTSRILGSKTGFTLQAGVCISALFTSNTHDYLIVLLNAERIDNKSYNVIDALSLIDFIDNNYNNIAIVKKDDVIKTIKVKYGDSDTYEIKANEDIKLYLPSDYDKSLIKIDYEGTDTISYKNKKNEVLGTVKYYYDNNLLKTEEIQLQDDIKFNIVSFIKTNIIPIVTIILITIIIFIGIGKICTRKKLEGR